MQNRGKKTDSAILRNDQFGLPGQFLAELRQRYGPALGVAQQLAASPCWAAHPKEPYFRPKFINASMSCPSRLANEVPGEPSLKFLFSELHVDDASPGILVPSPTGTPYYSKCVLVGVLACDLTHAGISFALDVAQHNVQAGAFYFTWNSTPP